MSDLDLGTHVVFAVIVGVLLWCLRHERRRQVDERFRLYQGEL
jgi:cbb3-type cytochrome oxidase subunit 3